MNTRIDAIVLHHIVDEYDGTPTGVDGPRTASALEQQHPGAPWMPAITATTRAIIAAAVQR